jgi:hypothetical protein
MRAADSRHRYIGFRGAGQTLLLFQLCRTGRHTPNVRREVQRILEFYFSAVVTQQNGRHGGFHAINKFGYGRIRSEACCGRQNY